MLFLRLAGKLRGAMTMPHRSSRDSTPQPAAGVEIACNLLDCRVSPPERVEADVRRLADEVGGTVEAPYTTGRTQQEIMDMVLARMERGTDSITG